MPFFCNRNMCAKGAFWLPLLAFLLSIGWGSTGYSQQLPGSDIGQLLQQQLGQSSGGGGFGTSQTTPGQQPSVYLQPVNPAASPPLPASRLEQIMSSRAGTSLSQFGYEQLGHGIMVAVPQSGAVSDDYILGPGDEIYVSLRGQENSAYRVEVDRNGQVVLPRLNPVPATGRTLGDFRHDLEDLVRRAFVSTQASVSVGKTRQISVLVSGEVNSPGQRLLTGLSSAIDALLISGGVKKTGSLRNVRIVRNGKQYVVDLYSVLTTQGSATSMRLTDGDRILVPPLGKTVAVTGLVRRPGIYELPSNVSSLPASSLLDLAGGLEVSGQYRLSVLRVAGSGDGQMMPLPDKTGRIGDSEILFVQLGASQTLNQATLSGDVPLAGQYPVITGTKLSDILKMPGAIPPEPYTLFGIIARKDSRTLLRTLVAFTPVAVLNGSEDQPLQSGDVIRVLSINEVRLLANTVRLYNERQDAEQAAIRNPLTGPVQTGTNPTLPAGLAPNGFVNGATGATGDMAELQRRDIAELATTVDPVTQQTNLAASQASRQRQMEEQQQFEKQNLQSQNPQSPSGLADPQNPPTVAATLPNLTSPGGSPLAAGGNPSFKPPALNFETSDPNSPQISLNRPLSNFADLARQLNVDQLVLVNFLIDHQVNLGGAVNGPGRYFVGPNVALQDLVSAAGGTVNWADQSGVELITTAVDGQNGHSATRRVQLPLHEGMLASYTVRPKDEFRFNQVFTDSNVGTATVQGEVHFSGTYQITRGEHLSDLLMRAGGLTGTAYPYGTVFLRKSAAAAERDGYNRAANEIEEELVVAMTRIGNDKIDASTFSSLQTFINQLRSQRAVGRIAISADPSMLASKPELDPLLEPGDVVYIPQRPSTISVLGQVMQPGSLPYRSNYSLKDYVQLAGGNSPTSDPSNTFIVLPDGSARRVETSWLGFDTNIALPPGSAIVVPRDVTPLDTRQLILDITGIMSQLAVSVASLAVINR